jgi:hypothetical protein
MNHPRIAVTLMATAVFVATATARSAVAQVGSAPTGIQQRVGADFGVASASGLVGVNYQIAPVHWLRLEGAIGWGPTGGQLSLMPKVAVGGGRCAFTMGFGPSLAVGGAPAEAGHGPNPGTIPWLNLDVPGIECRFPSGFSLQAALGLTMPLADFRRDGSASAGGSDVLLSRQRMGRVSRMLVSPPNARRPRRGALRFHHGRHHRI